ncbi:MAG: cytochrome d ubiquinol oxidase subunit II [Thermoleophilaceae bacterium]
MAEFPMVLILAGLAAYAVLGGADFGAGLWELGARGRGGAAIREHTHRAMAPVWEANHVRLIFVLVVCWTAYPTAFASIASTLTVPLFIAGIGVILRGASYAFRTGDPGGREASALSLVLSLSSVLTPFALGAAAGAIASGRVPVGNAAGDAYSSWLNPTSLLVGSLAVASAAYTAAIYLAGDARREGLVDLAETFRKRALVSGALVGAIAVCGPLVLYGDAKPLYDGLSSGAGLVAGLVSGIAGVTTLALVYRGRFEPARASAALAVAAIVAGWGLAQEPSFLPGLTLEEAAAGDATLVAIAVSVGFGMLILLPSLALLFRLVLSGHFDPGEESPEEPSRTVRSPGPNIPPAAVAATAGIGTAVTLLAKGWLLGVGLATMLVAAVLAFILFATPEEEA